MNLLQVITYENEHEIRFRLLYTNGWIYWTEMFEMLKFNFRISQCLHDLNDRTCHGDCILSAYRHHQLSPARISHVLLVCFRQNAWMMQLNIKASTSHLIKKTQKNQIMPQQSPAILFTQFNNLFTSSSFFQVELAEIWRELLQGNFLTVLMSKTWALLQSKYWLLCFNCAEIVLFTGLFFPSLFSCQ